MDNTKPSTETFLEMVKKRNGTITLGKGVFKLEDLLKIDFSLKIKGQGKEKTILEVENLISLNQGKIEIQDITLKAKRFVSKTEISTKNAEFICDEKINAIATSSEELKRLLKKKVEKIWITEGTFNVEELHIHSNLIGEGRDRTKIVAGKLVVGNVTFESLTLESKTFMEKEKFRTNDVTIAFVTHLIKRNLFKENVEDRFLKHFGTDKNGISYVFDGYFLYALDPDRSLKWKIPLVLIGDYEKAKYPENLKLLLALTIKEFKDFIQGNIERRFEKLINKIAPNRILIPQLFAERRFERLKYLLRRIKEYDFYELEISELRFRIDLEDYFAFTIKDDGTLFISTPDNFYVINPDGSFKWSCRKEFDCIESRHIVADDTVYVSGVLLHTLAFNMDGSIKWRFEHDDRERVRKLAVDDETLYVTTEKKIYALNTKDGSLKWKFIPEFQESRPGISYTGDQIISEDIIFDFKIVKDGNRKSIYTNTRRFLYSIDPTSGKVNWRFEVENWKNPTKLEVDIKNKTIYLFSFRNAVYAINLDGSLKWKLKKENIINNLTTKEEYREYNSIQDFIIGKDGNIYIIDEFSLYSLNLDGSFRWRFCPNEMFNDLSDDRMIRIAKVRLGDDGKIFVLTIDALYVLNPDGSLKWKFQPTTMEGFLSDFVFLNKNAVALFTDTSCIDPITKEKLVELYNYVVYTDLA